MRFVINLTAELIKTFEADSPEDALAMASEDVENGNLEGWDMIPDTSEPRYREYF